MPAVELDQQGSNRFQRIATPNASPGHCAVCGFAGLDRSYVDFGFSLDFYGAVIFCELCVVTMAETLGHVTPERYDGVVERLQIAIAENNRLGLENDRLAASLSAMLAGRDNYSNRALVEDAQKRSRDSVASNESNDSVTAGTEQESGTDDSGTAESSSQPRPVSVRKPASSKSASNISI